MRLQPVTFNVMNTMYPAHYRCTLIPADRVVANEESVMWRWRWSKRCGGGRNLAVCFQMKVLRVNRVRLQFKKKKGEKKGPSAPAARPRLLTRVNKDSFESPAAGFVYWLRR